MAAVHHIRFVGMSCGTTHEGPFTVAIACKNFVVMSLVVFKVYKYLNLFEFFCRSRLKVLLINKFLEV